MVGEEAVDEEGVDHDNDGGEDAGEEEAEGDGDAFGVGVGVLERVVLLGEGLVEGLDAVEEVEGNEEDAVCLVRVLYAERGKPSCALQCVWYEHEDEVVEDISRRGRLLACCFSYMCQW